MLSRLSVRLHRFRVVLSENSLVLCQKPGLLLFNQSLKLSLFFNPSGSFRDLSLTLLLVDLQPLNPEFLNVFSMLRLSFPALCLGQLL